MRFVLGGGGTSETLWSLHAALLDMGHESVLALPDISDDVIDRAIDGLFLFNLFEIGRDTVALLIDRVARQGRRPFLVHICLRHPLEEIGARTPEEVREADAWMARNRILMWCMCRSTAAECAGLGLTRIVHAPLGVHRWICAQRDGDGSLHLFKRWMTPSDPALVRQPYGSVREPDAGHLAPLATGRVIYVGQGWPEEAPVAPAIARSAESVAALLRLHPAMPRVQAMRLCGLDGPASDPAWLLAFHKAFAFAFAVENRRRFAVALRRALGDSLTIWGNGWDRFGIAAQPVSSKPRNFYGTAAACLDFGSLAYETAIFPRTLEVVKREGLLVSWRHADTGRLFGPLEGDLTFTDEEEAVATLTGLLADPERRHALKARHLDWTSENLPMRAGVARVLAAAAGP